MGIWRYNYDWNPTITDWLTYYDMEHTAGYQPFKYGFDLSFGLYSNSGRLNPQTLEKYGHFEVRQIVINNKQK